MKWINKASEDKSTRICWVYNDKGCGSKKATLRFIKKGLREALCTKVLSRAIMVYVEQLA